MAEHKKIKKSILISAEPYQYKQQKGKVVLKDTTLSFQYYLFCIPLWAIEKIDEIIDL